MEKTDRLKPYWSPGRSLPGNDVPAGSFRSVRGVRLRAAGVNYSIESSCQALEETEQAGRYLKSNVNVRLVLEVLFLSLRNIDKKKGGLTPLVAIGVRFKPAGKIYYLIRVT